MKYTNHNGMEVFHKIFADIFKLCTVIFFSGIWANGVIIQQAMNVHVVMIVSWVYALACIGFFIAITVIVVANRIKKKKYY